MRVSSINFSCYSESINAYLITISLLGWKAQPTVTIQQQITESNCHDSESFVVGIAIPTYKTTVTTAVYTAKEYKLSCIYLLINIM